MGHVVDRGAYAITALLHCRQNRRRGTNVSGEGCRMGTRRGRGSGSHVKPSRGLRPAPVQPGYSGKAACLQWSEAEED